MARVTVEDCVLRIPNRFELVALAGQRARNISAGAELTIDRDRDKNPVVALREIAEQKLDLAELEEAMIASNQRNVENERSEEDMAVALLASPGSAASARPAEEEDDDLDLASMAAELKAQAGEFKRMEED